ncbi:hypothetical protein PSTEL_13690 [Paenibacillus stellifer]|uniref:Lipoprotein n=1 Tax=Paenibacillus stellifer TaxID=169760 RepID=A0A089LXM1_9BACL|nr:hypothetical protein [Paenibacillus stellifer]AIQ63983.1 hypothetical protein PSTEL_13690 [Paenibacillus stellifer]
MKIYPKILIFVMISLTLMLSACGKDKEETSASSFSSVRSPSVSIDEQGIAGGDSEFKAAGASAAALNSASPESSPASALTASPAAIGSASSPWASPELKPTPDPKAKAANSASEVTLASGMPSSGGQKATGSSKPAVLPAQSAEAKSSGSNRITQASAAPSLARNPDSASPSPSAANADNGSKTEAPASATPGNAGEETAKRPDDENPSGTLKIGWSEFFDGDDQTRPSERFWDLSESKSQVSIKGFMGEVLSFEKHWFLLIPQPGAECPFDNGDETYWNKIMIVFVPEDVNLRHKTGPLQVTGRLEVGIKIDESGYKTMFRLYNASFKEVTE